MERRQPYIEVPYRPADAEPAPASLDSRALFYDGSASRAATRSHPSYRVADEAEIQSALEAEELRAMAEADRQRSLAEEARQNAEAKAALAADLRRMDDERAEWQRAEASRQRAEASAERQEAEAARASAEHAVTEQHRVSEPESVWYKEAFMGKRIIYAVVAVVVVVGFIFWLKQHRAATDIANGEIFSNDLTPGSRTRSGDVTPAMAKPNPSNPASVQTVTNADGSSIVIPSNDSQAPNAPEGARFSGTGKYQVYRQGNLTWRVNTENGESCILFATEEEWRKPIVFNHGCSAS